MDAKFQKQSESFIMKKISDVQRRTEILKKVINNEKISKADLAFEYDVAEVTISRDLQYLRFYGIPIYSSNNQIILNGFFDSNILEKILNEYSAFLPKITSFRIPAVVDSTQFFINFVNIAKCIKDRKKAGIGYSYSQNKDLEEFEIFPLKLWKDNFNWKLRALDLTEEKEKIFYVNNIEMIKILGDFELYENINVEDESNSDHYNCHFRFNKEVSKEVSSKIWFDKYEIGKLKDGRVDLFTNQPISDKLAGWCISWWDQIEIKSPPELRRYISEMIEYFGKRNL